MASSGAKAIYASAEEANLSFKNEYQHIGGDGYKAHALFNKVLNSIKTKHPNAVGDIDLNEDLATRHEWLAILLHYALKNEGHDCSACYRSAYRAYKCRGEKIQWTKNRLLFFPILAESFVNENKLQSAIDLCKLLGETHRKRYFELLKMQQEQQVEIAEGDVELLVGSVKSGTSKEKVDSKKKKNVKPKKGAETSINAIDEEPKTTINDDEEPKTKNDVPVGKAEVEYVWSIKDATELQLTKVDELKLLCSRHTNLLNVCSLAEDKRSILVGDKICPVEKYFHTQILNLGDQASVQMKWNHIHDQFQCIFRGIIQGLIFLHRDGILCGDLRFNSFVNTLGEARLIPSMDLEKEKWRDVIELKALMKSVINLVILDDKDRIVKLPAELIHFLIIKDAHQAPVTFLVNHPFFWTTQERYEFIRKLHKVIKEKDLQGEISGALQSLDTFCYNGWARALKRRYKSVYDLGNGEGVQVIGVTVM